jgi:hypothetical protein
LCVPERFAGEPAGHKYTRVCPLSVQRRQVGSGQFDTRQQREMSSSQALKDFDHYFSAESAAASKKAADKGESAARARTDIKAYFAQQDKIFSTPRMAHHLQGLSGKPKAMTRAKARTESLLLPWYEVHFLPVPHASPIPCRSKNGSE